MDLPCHHGMASKARRLFCGPAEIFLSRHRYKESTWYSMSSGLGWMACSTRSPPKALSCSTRQPSGSIPLSESSPGLSAAQMDGTLTSASAVHPRRQSWFGCTVDRSCCSCCSAAVLHCIILAEHTTPPAIPAATVPLPTYRAYLPTYSSKRSYAIIGSMSP